LIFGSVCSGIEAASVAWLPLGWEPRFYSEIESFPRAVLKERHPGVPIHGDFTTIKTSSYKSVDLLVAGTPCQDFSTAGLREGIVGARGNLTLAFVQLVGILRPRWIVWENVPGILSLDRGRTFGSFLGGLAELGYGFAYRILDAQYFNLAQHRERVFVVGCLGDWQRAAAILFERQSLSGDSPPSRERQDEYFPQITRSLNASNQRLDLKTETFIFNWQNGGDYGGLDPREIARTLQKSTVPATTDTLRRLTPQECERLQGFPDDYTLVIYNGKLATDGPRYKAVGNSMAVPVMRWIGERIMLMGEM
jgi:DNA (cytosine-5)-methyltransferase 1